MQMLLEDDSFLEFYDWINSRTSIENFLRVLSHAKPTLRILEIGAGTGGRAENVLRSLAPAPNKLYSSYTYTDRFSAIFVDAHLRPNILSDTQSQSALSNNDTEEQEFTDGSFDLIIASNVLSETTNLQTTLIRLKKLLAPGGYLLIQELSSKMLLYSL
jgi:ubiquinone/menaquinone biosynthesis C-methylase UbiE